MNAKKIVTWTVDSDGDFHHALHNGVLRREVAPAVQADRLIFIVLHPQGKTVSRRGLWCLSREVQSECLLNHFDSKFTQASATALPDFGDLIGNYSTKLKIIKFRHRVHIMVKP